MKKTTFPSETTEWRHADPKKPVMGREDFEDQVSAVAMTAKASRDPRPIEVVIRCAQHTNSGVIALYEDGLIVFGCNECGKWVGQAELAERARRWGRVFQN